MKGSSDASDRDIQNEVLPVEPDEKAIPIELDSLQPWHRPRKQFIRSRMWRKFSRNLIQRETGKPGLQIPPDGKPEVRYLTLPGFDYIDVELLADLCTEMGCILTSTGFLAGDGQSNPEVARAKIREQSLIDKKFISHHSFTHYRRLEEIAHEKQASIILDERGPYHIVNIDACGSIAPPKGADGRTRIIDVVYRILEFQLQHKTGSWLLFLTTDARPNTIDEGTKNKLLDPIKNNAQTNIMFSRMVSSIFGKNNDVEKAVKQSVDSSGENFLKFFTLGFSKWLIHLAKEKQWEVKTHETYCYHSGKNGTHEPTIVCMAYEFKRTHTGLHDSFNLAQVPPSTAREIEDTSVRAAKKVDDMENVVSKLKSCDRLREEMKNQTKQMLEKIGYADAAIVGMEEI